MSDFIPITEEKNQLRDIRNKIIAGIFIVIPVGVSLWLGLLVFNFLTEWAANFVSLLPIPEGYKKSYFFIFIIRIFSLFILIAFLFLVGHIAKYTMGKKIISYTNQIMLRLPMLKNVYITAVQILDTIKTSKSGMFTQAVLFEYPKPGIYAIGFVTNWEVSKLISEHIPDQELIAVFLPTTPNPTSGFFLMIPKSSCILLNIGIDNAMKMIISGGALQPGQNGTVKTSPNLNNAQQQT